MGLNEEEFHLTYFPGAFIDA